MLHKQNMYFSTTLLASSVLGNVDVHSSEGKGYNAEYPDSTADYVPVPTEGIVNGIDYPDLSYLVFDEHCQSDVSKEQPMSEESLREYLKKQLEFCFSRWVVKECTRPFFSINFDCLQI